MTFAPNFTRRLLLVGLGLFLAASQIAQAAEIRVITSGAFTEAYKNWCLNLRSKLATKSSARSAPPWAMHLIRFPHASRVAKSLTSSFCRMAA